MVKSVHKTGSNARVGKTGLRLGNQLSVVVSSVAVSTLLAFAIEPTLHHKSPLLPFILAIIASAWYGGVWTALTATVLSFLISDYCFIEPVRHLMPITWSHVVLFAVFIAVGLSVGMLRAALAKSNAALIATVERLHDAKHQSELVAQQAKIGFHEFRADENIQIWAPEMEHLFGLAPGTFEGAYSDWTKRMHPDDRGRIIRERQRCIAACESSWKHSYRAVLPDGAIRWLEGRSRLFYSNTGTLQRILGATIDVTEREQMEQHLSESNQELERFAYVVSHDLQEPLRGITTMAELILQRSAGALEQDSVQLLKFLVDSAGRMKRLIEDILTLARVSSEATALNGNVDVTATVNMVIQDLQPAVSESHANIVCDPLPSICASEPQMQQLFHNLISNAVKYRGERRPEIHISASRERDAWVFCVSDNGIGIDPKYHEHVFGAFQRLHGRSSQYPGTGLGLAICERIVRRHGGRIWVESKLDNGSRFFFALPIMNRTGHVHRPRNLWNATGNSEGAH